MSDQKQVNRLTWERFRFAVIGPLLVAPPQVGELQQQLRALAQKQWRHPIDSRRTIQLGFSTLERWYYQAIKSSNPVDSLKRQTREDAGVSRTVHPEVQGLLKLQYEQNKHWSIRLHYDNLAAKVSQDPGLDLPSYSTILRLMRARGWRIQAKPKRDTEGALAAQRRLQEKEVRSFEVEYVNALWHLDFHYGSIKLAHQSGEWRTPKLLSIIDDRSRLICHLQWYWEEDTRCLVHGFCQALQKRGLPRALMSDNGSAMSSEEFTQGLHRLSILHELTLPYSPYQNGKQETFWTKLEGRLMAMLVQVESITLDQLNDYTQAWVEQDYHRQKHRELGMKPLDCYLSTKDVGRACPKSSLLKQVFCRQISRKQRRSDGTVSLEGKRYEIPNAYRDIERIHIQYTQWDLSLVNMVTDKGVIICRIYPCDKAANANAQRRSLSSSTDTKPNKEIPVLLQQMIDHQAESGLPPAYLKMEEKDES
jgi:transposase InsO family protein